MRLRGRSKYQNIRTKGFDSKLEADRYQQLKLLEKAKLLIGLRKQVKLILIVDGNKICTIIPDFEYTLPNGVVVYEDAKGFQTPLWKLKWKLAKTLMPDCEFRIYPPEE